MGNMPSRGRVNVVDKLFAHAAACCVNVRALVLGGKHALYHYSRWYRYALLASPRATVATIIFCLRVMAVLISEYWMRDLNAKRVLTHRTPHLPLCLPTNARHLRCSIGRASLYADARTRRQAGRIVASSCYS